MPPPAPATNSRGGAFWRQPSKAVLPHLFSTSLMSPSNQPLLLRLPRMARSMLVWNKKNESKDLEVS